MYWPVPVEWWLGPVPGPLDEAVGLAAPMPMTMGVAVHLTAPAVTAVTVDVTMVPVNVTMVVVDVAAMTVDPVPVAVAMKLRLAVPLRMNADRGLVTIGQCDTGDYADRDPDRQRGLVIGPRRRCDQNSNEKRCEEECTHLVSSFREAWKPYAVRWPQSTGSRYRPVHRQDRGPPDLVRWDSPVRPMR